LIVEGKLEVVVANRGQGEEKRRTVEGRGINHWGKTSKKSQTE